MSEPIGTTGLFDIGDAGAFFASIERKWDAYLAGPVCSTEDLVYVVLGLNHLREWIAPRFAKARDGTWPAADTPEKQLSKEVYENAAFEVVRKLANGIKHAKAVQTAYSGGASIDDWEDFDAVADFDTGPPTGHDVDGQPVEDFVEPLLQLYRDWFGLASTTDKP